MNPRLPAIALRTAAAVVFSVAFAPETAHPAPARHWLEWCSERPLGWNFYCDPAPEPPPAVPEKTPPPEPQEAFSLPADPLQAVEAIRKRMEWLKARAVLDPSPDHVQAYLTFQQRQLDRASTFSDQWRRVVWATPRLDYTLRRPTGTLAKQVWLDRRRSDIEDVLAGLGERYGLFFFFKAAACPPCEAASPVLKDFADIYGLPVQAVSLDGGALPEWPDALPDHGRAKRMGLDMASLPVLALFDSQTKQTVRVGSGVLAADELAGRIYVQTQLALGEDY